MNGARRAGLLAIVAAATAFAAKPPSANEYSSCVVAVAHAGELAAFVEWGALKGSRLEPTRVRPAALAVLEDYRKLGTIPGKPSGSFERSVTQSIRWNAMHEPLRNVPTYGSYEKPLSWKQFKGIAGTTLVYRVTIDGRTQWFRPIDVPPPYHLDAPRKTAAGTILGNYAAFGTVPKGRFARVNGRPGFLQENAEGRRGSLYINDAESFPSLWRWLRGQPRGYDPRHRSNAQAFHFWIGNIDTRGFNFNVDTEGRPVVFDLEKAFIVHLPPFGNGDDGKLLPPSRQHLQLAPFGKSLPDRYTCEFVDALRSMTRERVFELVGEHLTTDEMTALLLRRDVILKDLELRGPDIYFP